jgi:hypothetical protein
MKMPALMTPKIAVNASNMAMNPATQQPDLKAYGGTQSKGFRSKPNFGRAMMISCNTYAVDWRHIAVRGPAVDIGHRLASVPRSGADAACCAAFLFIPEPKK